MFSSIKKAKKFADTLSAMDAIMDFVLIGGFMLVAFGVALILLVLWPPSMPLSTERITSRALDCLELGAVLLITGFSVKRCQRTLRNNCPDVRDVGNRVEVLRNLNFMWIEWTSDMEVSDDLMDTITQLFDKRGLWPNSHCVTLKVSTEECPTPEEVAKRISDPHKASLVVRPQKDGLAFCLMSKEGSSYLDDTIWRYLQYEDLSVEEQAEFLVNTVISSLKVNLHAGISGMIRA